LQLDDEEMGAAADEGDEEDDGFETMSEEDVSGDDDAKMKE
jgi:hypothetical protein